jgi:hypothetical protein
MTKTLLVTRANSDAATRCLYAWSSLVLSQAQSSRYHVIDLAGRRATNSNLHKTITNFSPSIIFFNGHGTPHLIYGNGSHQLINCLDLNFRLSPSIVYARCCLTAQKVGPALIKAGAAAYIGYTQSFIVLSSKRFFQNYLDDQLAKIFLTPTNQIPLLLMKGKSAGTVHSRSRQLMRRQLRQVLKSRVKYHQQVAAFLWHNIKYQTLLGNPNAHI